MSERKFNRREFLKIAVATAAAAGLSHFRFLNVGGTGVAYAQVDDCTNNPGGPADTCTPATGNADTCPEPLTGPADICGIDDSVDFCQPDFGEADLCDPAYSPDICDPADVPPDGCAAAVDACEPGEVPDSCVVTGQADACDPLAPQNPDVCVEPAGGDGDVCLPPFEEDTCPTGGPDVCDDGTQTPDTCNPTADPDWPNPVTVSDLDAASLSSALPTLSGVAAVLGAAALWLRHRLRPGTEETGE